MNEETIKLNVTLSVDHSDVIDTGIPVSEWNAFTDEEREEVGHREWQEWTDEKINGGWEVVE